MHIPVLLEETVEGLKLKNGAIVLDGTLGEGGHAEEICKSIGGKGQIIGLDQDEDILKKTQKKFTGYPCSFVGINANFRDLDIVLKKLKIPELDGILFDLGLRSGQLDESGRGFSFRKDEPLIMTFNVSPRKGQLTAQEIVNEWSKEEIVTILRDYGEERFAGRIAAGIVESRNKKPIQKTFELVDIIQQSVPKIYQRGRRHVARKTFQALRIRVNDELNALKEGLEKGSNVLAHKGRIVVISFHSLEDRIIKQFFKEKTKKDFTVITRKPIMPSEKEIEFNPRSRSAKLRILEKN